MGIIVMHGICEYVMIMKCLWYISYTFTESMTNADGIKKMGYLDNDNASWYCVWYEWKW